MLEEVVVVSTTSVRSSGSIPDTVVPSAQTRGVTASRLQDRICTWQLLGSPPPLQVYNIPMHGMRQLRPYY